MPSQKAARNGNYVRACRLGPELDAVLEARAQAEGVSPSEMLRNIVHAWAYSEMPSADQGYYSARAQAGQIAHYLIARAADTLPASAEELDAMLADVAARRTR